MDIPRALARGSFSMTQTAREIWSALELAWRFHGAVGRSSMQRANLNIVTELS
jgi:hypothetical protein